MAHRLHWLLVVVVMPAACATTSTTSSIPVGAVASLDAARGEASPVSHEPIDTSDDSAAGLLERGFAHFRREEPFLAGQAFRAAIQTGHLNDAGRALAYWHIYLAERGMGNIETGADALANFVIVSEEVMASREEGPYRADDANDFVQRFDLPMRLARARAVLSALWADKVPMFGRTASSPVLVHDENELEYFLEVAPPCGTKTRRLERSFTSAEHELQGTVTMVCEGSEPPIRYFFDAIVE